MNIGSNAVARHEIAPATTLDKTPPTQKEPSNSSKKARSALAASLNPGNAPKDLKGKSIVRVVSADKLEEKPLYHKTLLRKLLQVSKDVSGLAVEIQRSLDNAKDQIKATVKGNPTTHAALSAYFKRYTKIKEAFSALNIQIDQKIEELSAEKYALKTPLNVLPASVKSTLVTMGRAQSAEELEQNKKRIHDDRNDLKKMITRLKNDRDLCLRLLDSCSSHLELMNDLNLPERRIELPEPKEFFSFAQIHNQTATLANLMSHLNKETTTLHDEVRGKHLQLKGKSSEKIQLVYKRLLEKYTKLLEKVLRVAIGKQLAVETLQGKNKKKPLSELIAKLMLEDEAAVEENTVFGPEEYQKNQELIENKRLHRQYKIEKLEASWELLETNFSLMRSLLNEVRKLDASRPQTASLAARFFSKCQQLMTNAAGDNDLADYTKGQFAAIYSSMKQPFSEEEALLDDRAVLESRFVEIMTKIKVEMGLSKPTPVEGREAPAAEFVANVANVANAAAGENLVETKA